MKHHLTETHKHNLEIRNIVLSYKISLYYRSDVPGYGIGQFEINTRWPVETSPGYLVEEMSIILRLLSINSISKTLHGLFCNQNIGANVLLEGYRKKYMFTCCLRCRLGVNPPLKLRLIR